MAAAVRDSCQHKQPNWAHVSTSSRKTIISTFCVTLNVNSSIHISDSFCSNLNPVTCSTMNDLNKSVDLLDLDNQEQGPQEPLNLEVTEDSHLNFAAEQNQSNQDESYEHHSHSLFPSHAFDSDLSQSDSSDSDSSSSDSSGESDVELPAAKKAKVSSKKPVKKLHQIHLNSRVNDNSDPNIFDTSRVENIQLLEIGQTQKGDLKLFVKSFGIVKQMTIGAGGINKKSIKWRCMHRSCKGDLVTLVKVSKDSGPIIQAKESNGKRRRFELCDPKGLSIKSLEPQKGHKQHSCQQINDKSMIMNRILCEAKSIIDEKISISKEAARSLLPSEVVREATSRVVKSMNMTELERNRLNLDTFKLPRKIYRIIKAHKPTQVDFEHDALDQFEIPASFSDTAYKIDMEFARQSQNCFLLFCSPEIRWLNDERSVLILDGTFPLKRKLKTYSQMWIMYVIHPEGCQMVCFVMMRNRKESSYRLVLRQLKDKIGDLKVNRIKMDRELAENTAAIDLINHKTHGNCYFHVLQMWRRPLRKNLGAYLPSGRNHPTCDNSKVITRIWAHVRLLPYFPLSVSMSYIQLLIEKSEAITIPEAETHMREFLYRIRKDLSEIPSISWWTVLNDGDRPCWQDTTSNRLERFNLRIKQYINNYCINKDKTVEVITSLLEFSDSHRNDSLIFDLNQVGRKPPIHIRQRRAKIEELLQLLKLADTSLDKLAEIYQLVEILSL